MQTYIGCMAKFTSWTINLNIMVAILNFLILSASGNLKTYHILTYIGFITWFTLQVIYLKNIVAILNIQKLLYFLIVNLWLPDSN